MGSDQQPRATFEDLQTIKDAHGLSAIISRRLKNNQITVSLAKEFERDGQTQKTSFIPLEMKDAYLALVNQAFSKAAEYQQKFPPIVYDAKKNNRGKR